MSKRVTPRDFGETRADPVRSLLVLRAWAVWRARHRGWADARPCRKRHFDEQHARLLEDVRALGAPCKLLGNPRANAMLRDLQPLLVADLMTS